MKIKKNHQEKNNLFKWISNNNTSLFLLINIFVKIKTLQKVYNINYNIITKYNNKNNYSLMKRKNNLYYIILVLHKLTILLYLFSIIF